MPCCGHCSSACLRRCWVRCLIAIHSYVPRRSASRPSSVSPSSCSVSCLSATSVSFSVFTTHPSHTHTHTCWFKVRLPAEPWRMSLDVLLWLFVKENLCVTGAGFLHLFRPFHVGNLFQNSTLHFRTCTILWNKFHLWSAVIGQLASVCKHWIITLRSVSRVIYMWLSKVYCRCECAYFWKKNLKSLFRNRILK